MTLTLSFIIAHFIGDFLLQSDWMALNKSKDWRALAIHVGIYSLCFVVLLGFQEQDAGLAFVFGSVTFALHFATDAVTSRLTSRFWFFQREDGIWTQAEYTMPKHGRTLINPWTPVENKRHWFFVVIGADQLIHYGTLAWTLHLLTR